MLGRRRRHSLFLAGWLIAGLAATTPRAPLNAQARWTISEEIRIGTTNEGPHSFNDIRGFAIAPDGSILILDYQTQDIRVFDPRGRHVRTVGRSGSGPGELRNANGMATLSVIVAPAPDQFVQRQCTGVGWSRDDTGESEFGQYGGWLGTQGRAPSRGSLLLSNPALPGKAVPPAVGPAGDVQSARMYSRDERVLASAFRPA
jgi:hypothetical protein